MASYKFLKCAGVALLVALHINLAFGYCSSNSYCDFLSNTREYCCKDNDCCTYSEYVAEQATHYFSLGIGAIVGIVIGAIVLIIGCIVACVFCCCRPNRATTGRVVTTTQTVQQPVMMQNQYANQAAYPAGAQPYPAGAQPYPIGSVPPGQPPVYDQQAGVPPPMYPSKDGGVGGAMPPQY